jgi:hypothetical protein
MKKFKYIYILGILGLITACRPTITAPTTKGTADFTRYIALGNSSTAGYADGGLYLAGQLNSYPSIIAKQMATIGGGSFAQPLFTEAQASGTGYQMLTGFSATGSPVLTLVAATAVRGNITLPGLGTIPLFTKYAGNLENFGVPGIKLNDITNAAYGNGNPYYERLLAGNTPTNTTAYLDFATAKPFTFFTNWLGSNDAFGYALAGGATDALTDKAVFADKYNTLVTRLTANGAKGACATIIDITSLPYFTTVTVPVVLATVQKANPAVTALYINARNADGSYSARAATAADLIVLTFPTSKIGVPNGSSIPYGLHPLNPIENQYVLDANEVALVKDYIGAYNVSIKAAAAAKGLPVFDAFAYFTSLKANGLIVNGISTNSNYISGGVFSLDGVHLAPRGNAIVANQFIGAINAQYGTNIPVANVAAYNGVIFP